LTISADLRDRLWNAAQRAQLRALADLLDNYAELVAADAEEEAEAGPLHRRQHRTVRRNVRNDFLNALITLEGVPLTFDASALNTALAPVIEKHAASLRGLFGWRPDRCASPAAIARRVLTTIGLKLDGVTRMVNGERLRFYQVNAPTLAHMQALAHARLDKLRRQRDAERVPSALQQTANTVSNERNGTLLYPPDLPPLPAPRNVAAERKARGLPVNPYARATTCAGA
jgi:hypothetical protein